MRTPGPRRLRLRRPVTALVAQALSVLAGPILVQLVLAQIILAQSVLAQSAALPVSRAFAAADSSTRTQQVCVGDALPAVRSCALAKCRSAGGKDCRVTAACDRADWSGSVGVALQGSRFAVTICGVPSRPGLIARLKDLCRSFRSRGLESCTLETAWTPAGDEEKAGLYWSRQALGSPRSAAR